MASIQLALEDLSLDFGDGHLLKNVNLTVDDGESLVLIGPSGHGKSVVLKLFAGLIKPTTGRVLVAGHDLQSLNTEERTQLLLQMGMLFQKNALFDSLTVADNVAFPLREKTKTPEAQIQERVDYFLDALGIAHARDLFPDQISGGMQKRLGIARALTLKPKIVLYDDPTAGLDPITSRRIANLISSLREQDKSTLVSVTNDMARAYQLGDRLAMVVDGEIIVTGDKDSTLKHKDPRVRQFVRGSLDGPLTAETQ